MTETIVCVGAIVLNDAQVLLVRQSKGHSLEGQWTIPWGRLEPGESPSSAAVRETLEESGIRAMLTGLVTVQELPAPWLGWIGIVYACTHLSGTPHGDGRETDAARYFSAQDFDALIEPTEPWSAWLVRRVLMHESHPMRDDPSNPYHPSPGFIR
jgi:ADP-ribose pyrophosphatase YjhB (NUDIX family)